MLQFEHTQTREDGGGTLTITANTTEEVGEMLKHFNFGRREPAVETLLKEAELLKAGHYVKVLESEKRPWYVLEHKLRDDFVQPYRDRLAKLTGFDWYAIDFDVTPVHPERLCYTHYTDWLRIEKGVVSYRIFDDSEDWDGKKAADRVRLYGPRHVEDDLGERPVAREFIECGNGMYRHNPEYGKYKPPRPALACDWFWNAVIDWWRDNHASPKQRELMVADEELNTKNIGVKGHRYASFLGVRGYDNGLRTSWTDPVITWEEFKKL